MKGDYNLHFENLCNKLNLGKLLFKPLEVFGGHLNRVYKVATNKNTYAVKALNPQIMLRTEAFQNHINAENIAFIASENISALPAERFNNVFLHELNGQYYLVYKWIEGKSLFFDELTTNHCCKIGKELAILHLSDFSKLGLVDNYYSDEKIIDWNYYLEKGKELKMPWVDLVNKNIGRLIECNTMLWNTTEKLANEVVLSHGDLEPKNVLWQNDNSHIIIDWESAGFINPMHDLVETALYWAVDKNSRYSREKFVAFLSGYKSICGEFKADWNLVLDKGLGSKLGWLEYSFKRSLGIEVTDVAEQKMGTEHVFGTIKMLSDYSDIKREVICWLEEES